jgi:hypothetical protein
VSNSYQNLDSDESSNIFVFSKPQKGLELPIAELLAIEKLQKATGIKLSAEQVDDATKAILELTRSIENSLNVENSILAIVEALNNKPSLTAFAEQVRRVCLP